MLKKTVLSLLVLLSVGIGWYFISPYWALENLKAAVHAGDVVSIEAGVDFPGLRSSAKNALRAKIIEAVQQKDGTALAAAGVVLDSGFFDRIIEQSVTPRGIVEIYRKSNEYAGNYGLNFVDDLALTERGWNHFTAADPKGRNNIILIFERRDFGWKLTRVDLSHAQIEGF